MLVLTQTFIAGCCQWIETPVTCTVSTQGIEVVLEERPGGGEEKKRVLTNA